MKQKLKDGAEINTPTQYHDDFPIIVIPTINDTTYKTIHGRWGEVEIGDKTADEFRPHARVKKWDGEVSIDIQPMSDVPSKKSVLPENGKLKISGRNREYRFYPLEPRTVIETDSKGNVHTLSQLEDGGFEFEVILTSKPKDNVIDFDVNTKGLDFFYQPPLSKREKDNGAFRPENVVGSYAVYHSEKGNAHPSKEEAEKYKTGKAFHIYRPKVVDADGNETWGDLDIDEQNGVLTVSIDQEWLNNASYPVSVDPTFGYENIGDSTQEVAHASLPPSSNQVGTAFETTSGGDVTDLTAHILNQQGTGFYAGLYEEDGAGADSHSLYDYILETGTTSDWTTWSVSATISSGYTILILRGNADWTTTSGEPCDIAYDSVGTLRWYDESGLGSSPGAPSDPWNQAEAGTGREYSIYATYTAAAPPPAVKEGRTPHLDKGPHPRSRAAFLNDMGLGM